MEENKIILLTACVNPDGMAFTALQDANLRAIEYKTALKWYLKNTNYPIVVCENTLYDYSNDFKEYILCGRMEYLTFEGNNYDRSLGKGYGEVLILKYALETSKFVTKDSIIIKITGRTIVTNILKIVKRCSIMNNIYADIYMENGRMAAHSRFFVSPYAFLKKYFIPRISELNDSRYYYFEHLLYNASKDWEIDNKGMLEEPQSIIIYSGTSGSSGELLKLSQYKIAKAYIMKKLRSIGIYRNIVTTQFHYRPVKVD